jgi:hypothetical protein
MEVWLGFKEEGPEFGQKDGVRNIGLGLIANHSVFPNANSEAPILKKCQ